jgi:inhibitor of KinA
LYAAARYLPLGDCALLIEFGNTINPTVNRKVISLDRAIAIAGIRGIEETVPTYRSLLVRYDPMKITYDRLIDRIRDLEDTVEKSSPEAIGRVVTIPVVYGGEYGPDLGFVAQCHDLTEEQVLHAGIRCWLSLYGRSER